jgi:hypothetical protein
MPFIELELLTLLGHMRSNACLVFLFISVFVQFLFVNGKTPDKTMTRRNVTKKIIIGKTLHRKLTIEQKERNRN